MTLAELSLFYKNLSQLYSAGLNITSIFESFLSSEKNSEQAHKLSLTLTHLKKGRSLTDAVKLSNIVPTQDVALLHAGEKSGRLFDIFETLAHNYEVSAQAERTIRSGLAKPFFTFVFALFVPSLPAMIMNQITLWQYCIKTFGVLAVVLGVFYFLYQLYMKSLYDISLARSRYNFFQTLPFLCALTQKTVLEKFSSSLATMLEAGINIFEALDFAGRNSASDEIHQATQRILRELKKGKQLAVAFRAENIFNDDIQKSILLGNESGKLPEFLQNSSKRLKIEINMSIEKISKAIPVIIYFAVTLYMAFIIIMSNVQHMKELNDVLKDQ